MAGRKRRPAPPGFMWIYCKSYRRRDGKVMVAAAYGKQAWCFLVPVSS